MIIKLVIDSSVVNHWLILVPNYVIKTDELLYTFITKFYTGLDIICVRNFEVKETSITFEAIVHDPDLTYGTSIHLTLNNYREAALFRNKFLNETNGRLLRHIQAELLNPTFGEVIIGEL